MVGDQLLILKPNLELVFQAFPVENVCIYCSGRENTLFEYVFAITVFVPAAN